MGKKTKIISILLLVAGALLLSGCGCKKVDPEQYKLSLEIWGPLDEGDAIYEAIGNYQKINRKITSITYKKISGDTYQKELTEALASGQGPDILLINNTWLSSFSNKVVPAPAAEKVIDEKKFRDNFVDAAADDFLEEGKIYAVPLSVNSLGLFYNRDLFNEAGITAPPKTWTEFADDVHRLVKVNSFNEITQAGAAIGTAYNINRSTDLLGLLMLQLGAEMSNGNDTTFEKAVTRDGKISLPGETALDFYTRFAKTGSLYYTWNPTLHYSIDAFSEGTVAMMFNYPWNMQTISDKAPKLDFAVAPVPQFENGEKVNYASYWGYAVAKNKVPQSDPYGGSSDTVVTATNDQRIEEAWKFLTYLTTKPDGTFSAESGGLNLGGSADPNYDPAKKYAEKTGLPAARRDIIETQMNDPKIGVFAAGNLIAKSWRQSDPVSIEAIFAEMIDQVNKGQATVSEAIKTAAQRVRKLPGSGGN